MIGCTQKLHKQCLRTRVDDEARRQIASPVHVLLRVGKEAGVMAL
jgi:hypothetical protein